MLVMKGWSCIFGMPGLFCACKPYAVILLSKLRSLTYFCHIVKQRREYRVRWLRGSNRFEVVAYFGLVDSFRGQSHSLRKYCGVKDRPVWSELARMFAVKSGEILRTHCRNLLIHSILKISSRLRFPAAHIMLNYAGLCRYA